MLDRNYYDSFISSPFAGAAFGILIGGVIDFGRQTPIDVPFWGMLGLAVNFGYWFLKLESARMAEFEEEFARTREDEDAEIEIDFSFEVKEQKKETATRAGLFLRKKTFTQELFAINFDFKNVPQNLRCSLTKKLINDPVLLVGDGRAYERSAIEEHLSKRGASPFSGKKLTAAQCRLIENFNKRAEINAFVEQAKKLKREEKCEFKMPQLNRARSG